MAVEFNVDQDEIRVFPTVIQDAFISIAIPGGSGDVEVCIISPEGRKVFSQTFSGSVDSELHTVDISSVPYYGFAFIKVSTGSMQKTTKVFIESR